MSEQGRHVAGKADQLAHLLAQIQVPERAFRPEWRSARMISSKIGRTICDVG